MTPPKKIYLQEIQSKFFYSLSRREVEGYSNIPFISVEALKEWIEKNNSENPFSEKYHVGKVELLKFIES